MKKLLLISTAFALSGCMLFRPPPTVIASPSSCTTLIPEAWKIGVAGVDLPGLDATVSDLWAALDGQTGKLDQANGRTMDAIGIVVRCEERDKAAVKKATRGGLFR